MEREVIEYKRALYAGNELHTVAYSSSLPNRVHDNTALRWDYMDIDGRHRQMKSAFARILRVFKHSMWPEGPSRYVVECQWYETIGECPVAKTKLVKPNPEWHLNTSQKFVFLTNCYQCPVAIWPHDPLDDLPLDDVLKNVFDVIDRNQQQDF